MVFSMPSQAVAAAFAFVVVSAVGQQINTADKGTYTLFDPVAPASTPPVDLFAPSASLTTWLPPRFVLPSSSSSPIPTNEWWGNLIASSSDPLVQPVWTNPYSLRPLLSDGPLGLAACYPFATRFFGESTGNGNGNRYYTHSFANDFVFSSTEFTPAFTFKVTSWDDLSVSLRFTAVASGSLTATLVPGMAYVTAKYASLTPKFVTASAIVSVNGVAAQVGSSWTAKRFAITLANSQSWVLYTATSLTLTLGDTNSLAGGGSYSGYARVALAVSDVALAALDKSASCLLEGSNVEAKDAGAYMFQLKTSGDCTNGLFHYLQVHHVDTLDRTSATEVQGVTVNSATHGLMTGVVTKTSPPVIRFSETQNVPVQFLPPRRPTLSVVRTQKIKETLDADINAAWDIPDDPTYYANGKAIHKYANLCLVASDSVVSGLDKKALVAKCLAKLESALLPLSSNSLTTPLAFDATYRGIVSSLWVANNNNDANFRSGAYDDHHYRYGYWIAAAAIVNYLDPSWSALPALNRVVGFLIRDVANPSNSDTSFPKFRHFDWFRGHSLSHGITPFADGKDLECSSEEINFHYAVALFAKATGDTKLANIAGLMLKLSTRVVQNYVLLASDNRVHPPTIVANKVTGIYFENKVDYTTWFSPEKYAIHGLQMLPITPVTEFVRSAKFVGEEWDAVLSKLPDVVSVNADNAWLSLLYTNYATINKNVAISKLQTVSLEAGLTRTWALYIAATRA